jgi:hypothetical protein
MGKEGEITSLYAAAAFFGQKITTWCKWEPLPTDKMNGLIHKSGVYYYRNKCSGEINAG